MTDYVWPGFPVTRFQMRLTPAVKMFSSPYSNQVQTIDMLTEYWSAELDMAPDVSMELGLEIEAFFDRLRGAANRIVMSNLRVKANRGTMRGAPTLSAAVTQFANILPIATTPGATASVGDMLGCGGQLFRVLVPATADAGGAMSVEVAPRVRAPAGIPSGSAITYAQPTAAWRLVSANPAVDWHPGEFAAPSLQLREDLQ